MKTHIQQILSHFKQAILNDAVEIDTSREVQFVIIRTVTESWGDEGAANG